MGKVYETFANYTQKNRTISIDTSLGEDVLFLKTFSGQESFSSLFEYTIELLSAEPNINPIEIVGEQVIVCIHGDTPRYFCGHVKTFTNMGGTERGAHSYKAELVPWLWFLTRHTDCRVFQNKSVVNIVEEVIRNLGFNDFRFNLVGQYEKIEYCVQYNESDFDFISRLIEHEGIYYYFEHENGKHTLVFCDHKTVHKFHEPKVIEFDRGRRDHGMILEWEHQHQFFSGKLAQSDFDFEKFSTSLVTEASAISPCNKANSYELYQYPGLYKTSTTGKKLTTVQMEREELKYDQAYGKTDCLYLEPGKLFSFKSTDYEADHGKNFLVTEMSHFASEGSYLHGGGEIPYSNQFRCIPESVNYRPPLYTPRPRIDGVQTALVVGASGDEICTDKYGRIKIQFPWDRHGKKNDASSCWVRVASQQAGNKWGVVGIPRVGNEVVVTFIEGDPDRPLVIGSVFNNENMPPIKLPAGKTQTGMRSKSTSGGAGQNGFVVDDTNGNEAMNIHASYNCNFTVDNDLLTAVTKNATYSVDLNLDETIGVDHSMQVASNQSLSVGGNQVETVTGNQDINVDSNQTVTVTSDQTITANNQTTKIHADQNIETNNQTTTVAANQNMSASSQTIEVSGKQAFKVGEHNTVADGKISLKATEIHLSADAKITISVGGASITIDPTKVEIVGVAGSVKVDPMGVTAMGPKITLN